ncbi:chloride channel protein [uncultured Jatrophihabitans sp.]|uniref:chloride channel protein n=1 Tax=uncultured Jatrophihabitans sp. TaxID=1610747 RepID=UPI0035CB1E67
MARCGAAVSCTIELGLAALLLALKPLATAACLASGAIGGVVTPALATGALLGSVAARLADHVWAGEPVVSFAVVGAAAFLAVTQRAPVTATVLTLEFVGADHVPHVALVLLAPTALAVLVASGSGSLLGRQSRPRSRRPEAGLA